MTVKASPADSPPARVFTLVSQLLSRPTLLLIGILFVATFFRLYRFWELPPGLAPDEAFNGLDVRHVLQGNYLPIFFSQNGGREPLFLYLQTLAVAVLGQAPWVLRLGSVFIGILTVAILARVGRELFPREKNRYVSVLAAAALAVMYWHVNFSRLGLRTILLVPISVLVILFYWRGLMQAANVSAGWRDFIYAGIALGVCEYTYLSARLFPFVLIAFTLVLSLVGKFQAGTERAIDVRRAWLGLGIVLGSGALLSAPLLVDFYFHPDDFWGRASTISLTTDDTPLATVKAMGANVVAVLGSFFLHGDLNPRHNLPGRPALDPLLAIGLLVGLVEGMWLFRKRPMYALLFIWAFVMLLPSILSNEAPHFLRMLGALPPILLLAANGLQWIWQRVVPRAPVGALVLIVLLVGGAGTFHDYFQIWGTSPSTATAFDVESVGLANAIRSESETADVLVPLRLYGRPTLEFALGNNFSKQETFSTNFASNKPLKIVSAGGIADREWVILHRDANSQGVVLFPHLIADVAKRQVGDAESITDARGKKIGTVVSLDPKARELIHPPTSSHPADANFGNVFRLVGFEVAPTQAKPDQTVELALYWQPTRDVERDYRFFVHLLDANSSVQAQWDSEPAFGYYTTGLWQGAVIVTDLYPLHIPADAPLGEYVFEIGWTTFAGDRLPLLDLNGIPADDKLILGKLNVAP